MKNKSRVFVLSVAGLCAAEVAVVLLSWVVSALFPESNVRSLLGNAGLRWLLGGYERNVNTSAFFYFLITAFFVGAMINSGLAGKIMRIKQCSYNERLGVILFFIGLFVALVLCLLFAFYPRSVLLSVNGTVFSGLYFRAVLIVVAVVATLGSCVFILLGEGNDAYENIARALTAGLKAAAPVMLLYYLIAELVLSILYVFGI